jgi:hypothetical protein
LQRGRVRAVPDPCPSQAGTGGVWSARRRGQSAITAVCRRRGVALVYTTSAERAALWTSVDEVYEQLRRDPFTARVIEQITRRRGAGSPDVLHCPGAKPVTPRSSERRVIEGTWEWSVKRAELLAAGQPPSGADRNRGRWRLVMQDGRFELRNLRFGDVYAGTYSVRGNRIVAHVAGRPADELTTYRWSVYRNRLSLAPVEGQPFAEQLVVKPFVRSR